MRENDYCLSLLSFEVVCYIAMVTLLVQELSGAQHLVPALKQEKKKIPTLERKK